MKARLWFGTIGAVSLAALAAALVSQHVFDMQPCPWCVLQRLVFLVIAIVCLLGLVWTGPAGRRVSGGLVALLGIAGAASALWQHFVASRSDSCNLTLADRIVSGVGVDRLLPEVFEVRASCADAAVNLLGLPYEVWSLGLFALFIVLAALLLLRSE